MNGFTLLWSKILDSSIWMESKETRIVWITLLAMKDSEGMVRAAKVALAHRARVSIEECEEALKILMAPDPQSMTPENEGRRIQEVPGGWQILNHDLYRFSTEAKREFWKAQKAEQRQREKVQKAQPQVRESRKARESRLTSEARERRFAKAANNGDQDEADRIAAEGLPETPAPEPNIPELE